MNKLTLDFEKACDEIIIAGDLNFNMLDKEDSAPLRDFRADHGLNSVVKKGTRLNPSTKLMTLLDVLLLVNLNLLASSGVFPYPGSDHWLVIVALELKATNSKPRTTQSRGLTIKARFEQLTIKLKYHFGHLNLSLLEDVNVHWRELKRAIILCLDQAAPLKTRCHKASQHQPWYDAELAKLNAKRTKLYLRP